MKNFVLFSKIIAFVLMTTLVLFGCGKNEVNQKENLKNSEHIEESVKIESEIQEMLAEAEEKAAALQKKLTEDSTLKQQEMNELSYEKYCIWDDLLNELWAVLKDTLDEQTMNNLLEEQRVWITMKEDEIKKAGEAFNGGSMAPLASNTKAAELTKIRVYELADIIVKSGV